MAEPSREEFAPTTADRIARNESIFRSANEGIAHAAEEHEARGGVWFICECADATCRELVRLSLDEYRGVRAHPRHFLNAPGHEGASQGWGKVVAEEDHYVTVEKVGRAGETAEALADDDGDRIGSR